MRWWDGTAWTEELKQPANPEVGPLPSISDGSTQDDATLGGHSEDVSKTKRSWFKRKRFISSAVVALIAIASVTTILIVTAGPSAEERKIAADARTTAAAEAAADKAAAVTAQLQETCQSTLADFKTALESVNSKLSVGMSQDDLNTALGDTRVVYDQMDGDAIGSDSYCLEKVGKPLEDAFNGYVKSSTTWSKCIQDYDCEVKGSVLKGMQDKWAKAQVQILVADTVLKNYEPTGEDN